MVYKNIKDAKFISRPNRFIANIEIDDKVEIAHVKNTGRCAELFVPNAHIFVQECNNPARKTKYDIIGVKKGNKIINIDSQVPNKVFGEYVADGKFLDNVLYIKPETTYKNSRFDFYMETENEKIFVEVKGVTLEEDGIAKFPDAPTQRGVKHINELVDAVKNGYKAYIVFVIQMKGITHFEPNRNMHFEFANVLSYAQKNGVNILALDCIATADSLCIDKSIDVNI